MKKKVKEPTQSFAKIGKFPVLLFGLLFVLSMAFIVLPKMVVNASSSYSSYIDSMDTVKFNGIDWYIIEDNSTGAEPTVTLFSKEIYDYSAFNKDGNNLYKGSTVQKYLEGLTTGSGAFADVTDLIKPTDLTDVGVTGAKIYLLSYSEAKAITQKEKLQCKNYGNSSASKMWWLRTPYSKESSKVLTVKSTATDVYEYFEYASNTWAFRLALRVDLNKAEFDTTTKTFKLSNKYNLWVGDTQVTEENKNSIPCSIGTATFDPTTNTLTFNNAKITTGYIYKGSGSAGPHAGIYAKDISLTIKGKVMIDPAYTSGRTDAIHLDGTGTTNTSLKLDGDITTRIYARGIVTEKANIVVSGGRLDLEVSQAYTGVLRAEKDAEIIFENNVKILSPAGAVIKKNENQHVTSIYPSSESDASNENTIKVIKAIIGVATSDSTTPDETKPDDTKTPTVADPAPAHKVGDVVTDGGFSYEITSVEEGKEKVKILKAESDTVSSANIPESITIDNKVFKVTEIAAGAFKNSKKLKSVTIGANVEKIGSKAFYKCKKLKKVKVKTKLLTKKSVGSGAFKGIHPKAKVKVPKKKFKDYQKIFKARGVKEKTQTITK